MSKSEARLNQEKVHALDQPERLMQRLLRFENAAAPVISLYLDGRADQNGRQNVLPWVRKQLSARGQTYETHSPLRASFEEDFVRIVRYLENGLRPDAQGVAIFACSAAKDYFEVGQFAAPFERHRLFVYDRPHLYPLARLIDQYRRYAVLLADTNRARIFVFAAGQPIEKQEIQNAKTKHTKVGGWSQARYQRHMENYHVHHAREVVDLLARVVREENIEHVILGGNEQTAIPLLREQMPKDLAEKVIDVLSLQVETPEHDLFEESLDAFRRHDNLTDQQKVERLLNEYRADDLGVGGVIETLAAVSNGQVEEMLITKTVSNLEYDETEVKKVLGAYTVDGVLPVEIDRRVIADELIRRAEQLSSARVTFIADENLLEPIGGVGAFLRYRIADESTAAYDPAELASR
jgi:peptide chain release factor subunit 1